EAAVGDEASVRLGGPGTFTVGFALFIGGSVPITLAIGFRRRVGGIAAVHGQGDVGGQVQRFGVARHGAVLDCRKRRRRDGEVQRIGVDVNTVVHYKGGAVTSGFEVVDARKLAVAGRGLAVENPAVNEGQSGRVARQGAVEAQAAAR